MMKNFFGKDFLVEKDCIQFADGRFPRIYSDELNFLEMTDEELEEIIQYHFNL